MDLNICGGSYSLEAPISVQETINLFPEVEKQGSQQRTVLRRFPGLKVIVDIGKPIRGMKRMNGVLYVVSAGSLKSIDNGGNSTSIGTIAGTGPVSMATDGTNLVIVNGTKNSRVYNGTALSTVTLPFVSSKVFFLDTYFIHQRPGTDQFFISNSGSATTYTATDIGSKEGQPGDIIAIFVANRDLILFGEETTETWRNTGNPDFPFERQEGTFQERGAIGIYAQAEMDNTVYYLGDDRVVYALRGYQPTRISHHAIEKWLSEQSLADVNAVLAFTVTFQGHYWYILTFANGTWVFDSTASAMLGEPSWFQLKSWNKENYRISYAETAYGKTYCGGEDGIIFELDPLTLTDNGEQQLKRRVTPYYHNEKKETSFEQINLGFKEGVATSDIADPQVFLEISKDWGRTWSSRRQRSMGQLGQYKKKAVWRRNGQARTSTFRVTVTDNVDVVFTGQWGEVSSGQS